MSLTSTDYSVSDTEYCSEEIETRLSGLLIGSSSGEIECSKCGRKMDLRERLDNDEGHPYLTGYTRERIPIYTRGIFEVESIYCSNHQDESFLWNDFEERNEAYFKCGVRWHGEGLQPTILLPEVIEVR